MSNPVMWSIARALGIDFTSVTACNVEMQPFGFVTVRAEFVMSNEELTAMLRKELKEESGDE